MTDLAKVFADCHPRALDFPEGDYQENKDAFDQCAADAGYRMAGTRFGRVIFTTKAAKEPVNTPAVAVVHGPNCNCTQTAPAEPANPQGDAP